MDDTNNTLDLIWGADDIAKALGISRRRAYSLLEAGRLPARKVGKTWCVSMATLREWSRTLHVEEATAA